MVEGIYCTWSNLIQTQIVFRYRRQFLGLHLNSLHKSNGALCSLKTFELQLFVQDLAYLDFEIIRMGSGEKNKKTDDIISKS